MKTFISTIIISMLLALILIPAEKAISAEIKDVRFSSEPTKTRVVFELDENTQYKSQYDKENNITLSISKAKLSEPSKSFELKNGIVKDLFIRQLNDDTDARISLEKTAKYKIFTLGSPDRIVIDITPTDTAPVNDTTIAPVKTSIITPIKPIKPAPVEPVPAENIITPEVVEITPTGNEAKSADENGSADKGVEVTNPEENTASTVTEEPIESPVSEETQTEFKLPFKLPEISYHLLFLYAFDLMVLIIIILMSLRVRTTYRFFKYIKTILSSQSKEPALATISSEIEKERMRIKEEEYIKTEREDIIEKISKTAPKRREATNGKRKILVIDDKEITFNLTSLVSQAHGYETIYAVNGEEGLIKALGENPDLILLDHSSSAINADELCTKLKADKDTRKISIVMLLGEGTSDAILKAREIGADDYLVKPFTRRQLLEKINKFLEGGKARKIFRFLDGLLYQS